ncbi:MAG: GspE/PulE family protein [Candidatus Berkelbacteria bacterium]|nr:GspE/PulE family protein [Candidatus Berkelbacteria bacterium]
MADFIELANQLKAASTTKILDLVLEGAVLNNASDVHLEPQEKDLRIRYRIDGVLQEVAHIPRENYKNLLSRIKFLAKMDLNVREVSQEGRFGQTIKDKHYDFRCATLPVAYGENAVLRILEQEAKFYTLSELGFKKEIEEQICKVIKKPFGMILNTGPTGSGKTTTLYAILNELNKPNVKIITLEDPIEYKIEGIVQSQVDPIEGFGFAEGLKGALRADPDIIMIGEIRDSETANIALQAALTGHLVLSTFHANNSCAALVRLVEIGIKPYLLSGSINAVMAQRLVRKICPICKESFILEKRFVDYLKIKLPGVKIPSTLFKGKGCPSCSKTGYKGRIAIGEILIPNAEIEELLIQKAPLSEIVKKAHGAGFLSLEQDGLLKVISGITTFPEVFRVTRE